MQELLQNTSDSFLDLSGLSTLSSEQVRLLLSSTALSHSQGSSLYLNGLVDVSDEMVDQLLAFQ